MPDAVPGPSAEPTLPRRYRVADRVIETHDTITLDLEPIDEPIASPRAGQFAMLYAFGVGEAPISFSGLPEVDGHLRHTIRSVGAVTRALTTRVPGDVVGVRGPYGTGWSLDPAADRDVVVIAGGIGIAPLRPLVLEMLGRTGDARFVLLVGARTPDDLLFRDELASWAEGRAAVGVTVDAAAPGWTGDVGLVTSLLARARFDPARTSAYVCGPEVMMRITARTLVDGGVTPGRVQVSLERNMQCAVRHCGHCQIGPAFVCVDGPVFDHDTASDLLAVRSR